jgi:type II secretory pathway pseudopilin PulG
VDDHRGFALAATLMVLALLSVLGAAAIQSLSIETRISAHDRDARVALYVAETALGEARYYASRAWGKIRLVSPTEVVVDTPLAAGLSWEADRYRGFTLYDRLGASFDVTSHTDDVTPPILTLAVPGQPPADGRFSLVRLIPAAAQWSASELIADDDAWAAASPLNCWAGWTLWNADGEAFRVDASSTGPATVGPGLSVRLRLAQDPSPGPYQLTLNPWLRNLAAGVTLPGDGDAAQPGWDRSVHLDAAHRRELGSASVAAVEEAPGRYRLTATGSAGPSLRQVSLRVARSGCPDQRSRDWAVVAP